MEKYQRDFLYVATCLKENEKDGFQGLACYHHLTTLCESITEPYGTSPLHMDLQSEQTFGCLTANGCDSCSVSKILDVY